jgi:hypothetical protein
MTHIFSKILQISANPFRFIQDFKPKNFPKFELVALGANN